MRNTYTTTLLAAVLFAGCYQEYQPATTPAPQFQPQPVYVQGPPGGQMDEQAGYAGAGGEFSAGAELGIEGGAGGASVGVEGAIDAGPAPSADPQDPGYVMGTVTDAEIDTTLDGYGYWVEDAEYGRVWRPDATVVGVDFTPYETCGTWQWTDFGWTFACDWSWGWLPFHYGYWGWFDNYWGWVPDYTWSPAWVEWRSGGGYVGWRPVGPRTRDHRGSTAGGYGNGGRGPVVRDHRGRRNGDADWRFVSDRDLAAGRRIRPSLVRNNAEGLRATSIVAKPPIRAASTANARITDVMRNRITQRNMTANGGRDATNRGNYRPSSPSYGSGSTSSTPGSTVWTPPARGWQQNRGYQSPSRTYQPSSPSGTWQQPSRPTAPSGSWQQPSRPSTPYAPPARSWTQPSRTYTPSTPSRTYTPPDRTYTPSTPSRTYTPSAPSAPSRSYSPPSRSYAPSSSSSSRATPSSSSGSSRATPSSSSGSSRGGGGRRR